MVSFTYTASNAEGQVKKGIMEADSYVDLYAKLRENGFYCMEYKEKKERAATLTGSHKKLKVKELALFCRKIGTMLNSGLTIVNALNVLYTTASKGRAKDIFLNMYENIQKGSTLSETMWEQGKAFPPFLLSMVQSGESSGTLDMVMLQMSAHYEKENKLLNKIKAAMVYPILLLVIAIIVIILLFVFVLPRVFVIFEGNATLPVPTLVCLAISDFLVHYWYWVILGASLIVLLFRNVLKKIPAVRLVMDKAKIKIAIFGKFNRTIYAARFARSMSVLYANGISMLEAIRLSSDILDNSYINSQLAFGVEKISSGMSLSSSLEEMNIFDPLFHSMVKIGEESGSLDAIFASIADYYDEESEAAIQKMMALLEPVLLVILALIIGFILVAVILPIYTSFQYIA